MLRHPRITRLLALQLSHEMVGMGSFRLYAHGIARSDGLILMLLRHGCRS